MAAAIAVPAPARSCRFTVPGSAMAFPEFPVSHGRGFASTVAAGRYYGIDVLGIAAVGLVAHLLAPGRPARRLRRVTPPTRAVNTRSQPGPLFRRQVADFPALRRWGPDCFSPPAMVHTDPIILLPVAAAVLIATVTDLRSRRIPNWLVLPFLLAGIITSAALHGWSGVGNSLLGILTGVGVLGIFAWRGGMGMGDVKLCAAGGAWLGPHQLVIALLLTGLAGGVMALGWALLNAGARSIPYAPAIATGMLLSFWAH